MSATCDACAESAFGGVSLCPLHAEAEAMRDVLRVAIDQTVSGSGLCTGCLVKSGHTSDCFLADARAILARIDGDTPDA